MFILQQLSTHSVQNHHSANDILGNDIGIKKKKGKNGLLLLGQEVEGTTYSC